MAHMREEFCLGIARSFSFLKSDTNTFFQLVGPVTQTEIGVAHNAHKTGFVTK
jgi:hypothetical protein